MLYAVVCVCDVRSDTLQYNLLSNNICMQTQYIIRVILVLGISVGDGKKDTAKPRKAIVKYADSSV